MILSVSRRTDIPRWYSEWLLRRLRAGEVLVRNPYRPGQLRRVPLSPAVRGRYRVLDRKTPPRCSPGWTSWTGWATAICFSSPSPPTGRRSNRACGTKRAIVETFQVLGCRLGRGRVLWRYDPILFTDAIGLAWHEARFRKLCKRAFPVH